MADLLKQLTDLTEKASTTKLDEGDRQALLQGSLKLHAALESPIDLIFRLAFSIYDPIVLRLAIDLKLIDITLQHGGPIDVDELASKSGAQPDFILRILRLLTQTGIFAESGDSKYTVGPSGPLFAIGSPLASALIHFTHMYHGVAAFPEFFASNNYAYPSDCTDAPLNLALNMKGETYFDFLARPENKRLEEAFNMTMEMQRSKTDDAFVPSYPAAERLANADSERMLFVDVGGSLGHQARKFQAQHPNIPGKIAVEDLPQVIEAGASIPESILKVAHDFFKPQPTVFKHAKAFYLRTILHDWPDAQARIILQNIVDVMAKDSVVLIHEAVLPASGTSHTDALIDWHMATLGALERTEKQWVALADSVGLEINGIWWEKDGLGRRGIIELGLKG